MSATTSTHGRTVWTAARGMDDVTSTTTDVVIVGAGIVGLSLATMLGEAGQDVTVVARHNIGDSTTGRSTAKVSALHQGHLSRIEDRHGHDAALVYGRAAIRARDWVAARARDHRAADAVMVARTSEEWDLVRREAELARAAGMTAEVTMGPGRWWDAVGELRVPDQLLVDPVRLLLDLVEALPPTVRVRRGTVTSVRDRSDGVVVRGEGWSIDASQAVVATGLPILDRGGWFGLCTPSTSYVVAIAQDPAAVPDPSPMLITAGGPTRSVRWATTDDGPVLLVGGSDNDRDAAGTVATLESWARSRYDGLGRVVATWSSLDYESVDSLPVAGPLWRFGGSIQVVTGLHKWGLTLGVACADAIADQLLGRQETEFGQLVAPDRLPDLQALRETAAAQLEVTRDLASGWIDAVTDAVPDPVPEGEGVVGRCGIQVCAASTTDGRTRHVSAACTHLGGAVHWNAADRRWDCPLHGSRFDPDGGVVHGPAVDDLDLRHGDSS